MTVPASVFLGVAWVTILGASLAAVFRGGSPERIGGAAFFVTMAASWEAYPHNGTAFEQFEPGVAAFDLCFLIVLLFLAVWAIRWWPVAAAAAQIIACLAHLAKALDPTISSGGYVLMEGIAIWPISVALIAGTILHGRRLRTSGADLSWKRSLPPAAHLILLRLRLL